MKLLETFEDLDLKITTEEARIRSPGWDRIVAVTARVVGTDGMVRDDRHVVEFSRLRVTKRSVQARWLGGHVFRPRVIGFPEPKNNHAIRTITVPRTFNGPTARKSLNEVRHRLAFLIAPQHPHLFGQKEARDFCADLHGYIVVHDVMSS